MSDHKPVTEWELEKITNSPFISDVSTLVEEIGAERKLIRGISIEKCYCSEHTMGAPDSYRCPHERARDYVSKCDD